MLFFPLVLVLIMSRFEILIPNIKFGSFVSLLELPYFKILSSSLSLVALLIYQWNLSSLCQNSEHKHVIFPT